MNLESQCVSLDLAKRLRELKVKQESLFYWHNGKLACPQYQEYNIVPANWISAFTIGEIGDLLPININERYFTTHRCIRKGWWVFYSDGNKEKDLYSHWSPKEVDARAKMLIHLIENGLMPENK